MYTIEFKKQETIRKGIYGNIESITIDSDDIIMMKYIDIVNNGDKNLVSLYLKYLKFCRKRKEEFNEFTIINNSDENERVISSIIECQWLINRNSIEFNLDELLKRKNNFQEQIIFLNDSKKENDKHKCLLMQYYIDTIDKYIENKKVKVLKN